jgi:hypothetical protein
MGAGDQNVDVGITGAGYGRPPASCRAFLAGAAAARSPVASPAEQRRARRIAMGKAELDAFLTAQLVRVGWDRAMAVLRGQEPALDRH